ncbi:hypothetical protein L195_g058585, partial [Trifolium pratense]
AMQSEEKCNRGRSAMQSEEVQWEKFNAIRSAIERSAMQSEEMQ